MLFFFELLLLELLEEFELELLDEFELELLELLLLELLDEFELELPAEADCVPSASPSAPVVAGLALTAAPVATAPHAPSAAA